MAVVDEGDLAAARSAFGRQVAKQMGYSGAEAPEELGAHLQLSIDNGDVILRFDWCGREMTRSVDDDPQWAALATAFAGDIADDLKEHRGRGERLPWDDHR